MTRFTENVLPIFLVVLGIAIWSTPTAIVASAAGQDPVEQAETGQDVEGSDTVEPAPPSVETYAIDNVHSSVLFSVAHMGLSFVYGRFNEAGGEFVLDRENLANSRFNLSVETASVDTNHEVRDEHLRTDDFFNVEEYPRITFESTAVQVTEEGWQVQGNLTMLGVTKEVILPLRLVGEGEGMQGEYRVGFFGSLQIKRSDYGMNFMLEGIGDDVAITMSFQGIRQ